MKNPIIPLHAHFYGTKDHLDLKAICIFAALGYFLDDDTYYTGQKVLRPAHVRNTGEPSSPPYFNWHHDPVDRGFDQTVDAFAELFEAIVDEQTKNQQIILPLSGGLDSRTQAAALFHLKKKVNAYSYGFPHGIHETKYARAIAEACGFPFSEWFVPRGYLWNGIETLATLNQCYAEFTHPRQFAFLDRYREMGDRFNLGHWGDVLFDNAGLPDNLSVAALTDIALSKVIKKGGLELATSLWQAWQLPGDFRSYLWERVHAGLNQIDIPNNANARFRAYKSLTWAPRWTSVNLAVYESQRPVDLPYYDERMCRFICTVPESYLAGRKIQIAYLKKRMPALAKITWQDHRPFNLYSYRFNRSPYNFPIRVFRKLNSLIGSQPLITRNWELQFTGDHNEKQLESYLLHNPLLSAWLPESTTKDLYHRFREENPVKYAHPVSMLLTLSLFSKLKHAGTL